MDDLEWLLGIPDYSNSVESKIFEICLDGDVVVGSFDIGWQPMLIWIGLYG